MGTVSGKTLQVIVAVIVELLFGICIMNERKIVWTIGHSTRPFEEFTELLAEHQIQHLIDIRRFPGSRRFPQYNKDTLARALPELGIEYTHLEGLGGSVPFAVMRTTWKRTSLKRRSPNWNL